MSRNLTSLRYKCQFLINIQPQNNKVKHHVFLSQQYAPDRVGLESVGFEERGKPDHPEKNLSVQGRLPTTNWTHKWRRRLDLNLGHLGGGVLPIVRQHCFPYPSPPLLPHIGIEEIILACQSRGIYYPFRPPPHPLRMFFTAFFISLILQQYTSGFIKELTKITVVEKS